jgi:hypothetical protein
MKLKNEIPRISEADKAAFFDGFFTELCKVPFGSMGKRDMECLLIKQLYDRELIDTAANRQAACPKAAAFGLGVCINANSTQLLPEFCRRQNLRSYPAQPDSTLQIPRGFAGGEHHQDTGDAGRGKRGAPGLA